MYLPLAVTLAIMAFAGGPLITWFGYYNPILYFGGTCAAIGAGLFTTLDPDSSAARWIIFQIVYAMGIGVAFMPPYMAVQLTLKENLVPTALVMLSFAQQVGGIVVLAIAQNVFLSKLKHNLAQIPGVNAGALENAGATAVVSAAPPQVRGQVLVAYNDALRDVFYIVLALTCIVVVCMFGLEWRSVKKDKDDGKKIEPKKDSNVEQE